MSLPVKSYQHCGVMMEVLPGIGPYGLHFACHVCEKVFMFEAYRMMECAHPEDHVMEPPKWVVRSKQRKATQEKPPATKTANR